MAEDFVFEDDNKEPESKVVNLPPLPAIKGTLRPPEPRFRPSASIYGGSQASKRSDNESKNGSRSRINFAPEKIIYNNFYVGITGYIEYGEFPFLDGLCCRYSFTCGKNWKLIDVFPLNHIGYRNRYIPACPQVRFWRQ